MSGVALPANTSTISCTVEENAGKNRCIGSNMSAWTAINTTTLITLSFLSGSNAARQEKEGGLSGDRTMFQTTKAYKARTHGPMSTKSPETKTAIMDGHAPEHGSKEISTLGYLLSINCTGGTTSQ